MQFQPSDTLRSRTFLGLLVAQFLAAFNDQAIHASAMFFAINQNSMTRANAISLMPILFYAPWAIFCTLAGYFADRFSKRDSLVFWKIAEVGITLIALAGFWLGSVRHDPLGPWIVLSTVFLMGTHSAFFVPAKYGAMPEILQPHLLSKGNGILESLSFLAVILGTVSGGMLIHWFKGREYVVGILLTGLALLGVGASFFIRRMPAANPHRAFPTNLFKPLLDNLRILMRSRPLALAVLGIAFFTFMVAFMRATVYMHGETRNPPWDEFHTSLVVGVVALGIGLGSPLAGFLSGGKVELGLVPLGSVGMIVCLLLAAVFMSIEPGLITCLVGIGFFTGFYIVPLFTLLQHRAPKAIKGELLASSNFINVVGAIAASLLFKVLVMLAGWVGITQAVMPVEVARGELVRLGYGDGRPALLQVQPAHQALFEREAPKVQEEVIIESEGSPDEGSEVIVGRYQMKREGRWVTFYRVQPADKPLQEVYDEKRLPRFLFLGASLMTLGILFLLCRQLPDFFVRALLWLRGLGRYRVKVVGISNLPSDGPVILATNCHRFEDCMHVVGATDRFTRFILLESERRERPPWLLRYLARRTGLVALRPGASSQDAWDQALAKAAKSLGMGNLVGLTANGDGVLPGVAAFLEQVRALTPASVVPVYCGTAQPSAFAKEGTAMRRGVWVVIGQTMNAQASTEEIHRNLRLLGEWIEQKEQEGVVPATVTIPGASGALPTKPAAGRPAPP
jgi:MFS family permease